MASESKKPTHTAYVVREGKDDKSSNWREVGVVFAHKDGKGFDVLADAWPAAGKLVIRANEPKPKADK